MHGTARPEELEERLLRIFHERMKLEIPSPEMDLLETGVIDSLTFVELLVLVEEEFGVTIDVAELEVEVFRSVRRIACYLAERGAIAAG